MRKCLYGIKMSNWEMVLWHHAVVISIAWKTKLQKWKMSTALVIQFFEISCLWCYNSLFLQFWRKFREKEYPSWASGGLSFHHKVVIFIWKDGIEGRRKKSEVLGFCLVRDLMFFESFVSWWPQLIPRAKMWVWFYILENCSQFSQVTEGFGATVIT